MNAKIKFYKQRNDNDCGLSCIKTIYHFYDIGLSKKIQSIPLSRTGASVESISHFLNEDGFSTEVQQGTIADLKKLSKPVILFWRGVHFVVLYGAGRKHARIVDPAYGKRELDWDTFADKWLLPDGKGVFIDIDPPKKKRTINTGLDAALPTAENGNGFYHLLFKHKRGLSHVLTLLFIGSIIQLIIPFLTQSIVDRGINNNDMDFIQLVIIAQIFLFVGSLASGFVRSWIMLHIGIRINIDLSEEYVKNILSKPIQFFVTKKDGDLLQRIFDNIRIERFMTITSLSFVIAVLNLITFSIVIFVFSFNIFLVFFIATVFIIIWMTIFMARRKMIDQERFIVASESRNIFLEIIHGIEEIHLNNLHGVLRNNWLAEQMRLLRIRLKLLLVSQYQQSGASSINQIKNVIITFLSAKYVLEGQMTIGSMLAIQYLIGQLNTPIRDIVMFIQDRQDAKLSIQRLSEIIHEDKVSTSSKQATVPASQADLRFTNVQVHQNNTLILKGISMEIPYGAFVAIVGQSGCGKTTLLKTISKLIEPSAGSIRLGDDNFARVDKRSWVEELSVIAQDGYIFSDTLLYNITLTDESNYDEERLLMAIQNSFLTKMVQLLPMGLYTNIGKGGKRFSKGQIQRILIARAIYKNGNYLLLDEATSALDKSLERKIKARLLALFEDRTILAVSHKVDVFKSADLILFMQDGQIVERGTHESLMDAGEQYYKHVTGAS